jgi:IS5 family transposase
MAQAELQSATALGADKGYDVAGFVAAMRQAKVTPHVTQKAKGSAIDGRTPRHAGYQTSSKTRKRTEEIFALAKTVSGLRKTRCVGRAKVAAQTVFTFAAYNLTRMATIFGWRLSTV